MPIYQYKARDEEGRSISGRMDVAGEEELQRRLESSGFFLVKFSLEKRNILKEDIAKKLLPVTLKDLYTLTLQLGNTVSTGVPLLVSLGSIAEGFKNRKLETILKTVIEDLKSGSSFAEALSKHPKVFSKFYTSMVELGEASGTLPKIFYGLAEYTKKEMEIKRRIIFALIYPAILTLVGTALVTYILINIIPKFMEIFIEEGLTLPLPTRILLALSDLLTKYWPLLLAALGGVVISFWLVRRTGYGGLAIDRLKLRIPVIGRLLKKICGMRFIDGLYSLYASGLPILRALNIVKSILRNRHLERMVDALWVHISGGRDLASFLALTDFFPPDILAMIKSGEESGTLQNMLEKASSIYHDEVNYSIEALISLFEIAVILMMGVGIGFIAMAVLFPYFRLVRGAAGA